MPKRCSKGDDAIYFEHEGPCKDSTRHRRCPGRWRGEITTGRSPQGRRLRRRLSGPSKAAVQDALKNLRKEIDGGITNAGSGSYTVRRCCEDRPTSGLPGRDPKTVAKNRFVLEPELAVIGNVRLRDMDVTDVDDALAAVAVARSSSTVAMAHLALTRAITRAQAMNLVLRNVSALTGIPPGQESRPSRSMSLAEATAVTAAAQAAGPRTHAYVMLSLCTGCGPRKRGPFGGSRSTSATPTVSRRGRRASRCGGLCGPGETPRPGSPAGPLACRGWQ